MWHEVSAPRSMSDVAWSHQKVTELSNWLRTYAAGPHLRVLVMSGPSGCGKLSTLQAMFPLSSGIAATQGSSSSVSILGHDGDVQLHVFHGIEGGLEELSSFLGASRIRSQRPRTSGMDLFVVKSLPSDGAFSSSSSKQQTAVRAVLAQHLRQLQQLNTANTAGISVRALTVFLCTIHDVHSDKVALSDYFGASFASSPLVHKFRCTGVTEKNMATRLMAVARAHGKGPLDLQLLNMLCSSSHGDMRQALLQLQWALLTRKTSVGCSSVTPRADRGVKRSRDGPVASRTAKKNGRSVTVLDLIDDDGDAAPQPSQSADALSAEMSVFCRDDCINISHGAARLLTQKYTIEQLRAVISVPPWKVFSFFTNNILPYFHDHQIEEYAHVARYASAMEPAVLQLSERGAFSSARSIEEEQRNMSVAEMALVVLTVAYRHLHKDVKPQAFMPHGPPPFQPFYFPRFVEGPVSSGSPSLTGIFDADDVPADRDLATRFQHVGLGKFAMSAEYGRVREALMGIDRKTCPAEELVLDYFPFAKLIVLDSGGTIGGPSPPVPSLPKLVPPPLVGAKAITTGLRRTMFVTPAAAPQPKRLIPVSESAKAALSSFDSRLRSASLRSTFCLDVDSATWGDQPAARSEFQDDDIENIE